MELLLIGGLEHGFYFFHFIYGMSSFPLTFICFRGIETTNQKTFFLGLFCFGSACPM